MKKTDDEIRGFAMNEKEIMAFVYSKMGATKEARSTIKKMLSYDRLLLGKYALIKFGDEPEMTDVERLDVVRTGDEFYDIYNAVDDYVL